MRIEPPPPIRQSLPLTPLVDIVFLLLMFFMLSTTFTKFGNLDLRGGSAQASNAPAGTPDVPSVLIRLSKGPMLKVNGEDVVIEQLASRLDELYVTGARSGGIVLSFSAEVQDM